jgi:hypothetical protein
MILSVRDWQTVNPYAAPTQDEELVEGATDADPGVLRYRYVYPFKIALRRMLVLLASCALCVWVAVNYDEDGIWLLGASLSAEDFLEVGQVRKLFSWLAVFIGTLAVFGIGNVSARFRPARYLLLDRDQLSLPLGRALTGRIPYGSIKSMTFEGAPGHIRLRLTTKHGQATVHGNRFESSETLYEMHAALQARITALSVSKDARTHQRGSAKRPQTGRDRGHAPSRG